MTREQWNRVKDEFEQAREAATETRSRVLAGVEDDEIRRELDELLRTYDGSQEFLERPAILNDSVLNAGSALAGQRLGSYSLVRQVGEGGMGVVYEAVRADGEFDRRVAIKVVKLWLKSERENARFRAERQILARLDHPNIARLIDGGTTSDGLPFLVMEFVDGVRIDEYCMQNTLDVEARLQLFGHVCEAVEYAHGQGVIHRDLKPANILVVGKGEPKLLDFGIAKVVDPDAAHLSTVTVSRPATPQYASPEQLRGEPTTPSSDIYSLGVLLYELLTFQSPYGGSTRSLQAISRAMDEGGWTAPSKLTGNDSWRRTLDRIVANAMQKNPADRYARVQDLNADIDRYLSGNAVRARGGRTRWRHRRPLFAPSLAGILLLAIWALWMLAPWRSQFQQLYSQGKEREHSFDLTAARSLFQRAVDADPKNALGHYEYGGVLHTLGYESLATREAKLANDLSSTLKPEEQLLVSARYQQYSGNREGALAAYKKLSELKPANLEYRLDFATAQAGAGLTAAAVQTLKSLTPRDAGNQARVDLQLARTYGLMAKYSDQLVLAQTAASKADILGARQLKAEAFLVQGDALREMNRFDEAVKVYADAETLSREDGDLYEVASIENRLGSMYFNRGDYAALEAHSNTALALFRQIDNKPAQASIYNNLSLAMKSRGDSEGALEAIKESVAISREADDLHFLSRGLNNLGIQLRHLGRAQEARQAFEESLHCAERLGDRDQIARSHLTLEGLDRDDGNLQAAIEHVRTALNLLRQSKAIALRALASQHLGDDIHASGDVAKGKAELEESLDLARQANSKQLMADDAYMLSEIAREQGDFAQSAKLLKAAEPYYISERQKLSLWDAWVAEGRLRIAEHQAEGTDKKLHEAVAGFRAQKDDGRACAGYATLLESWLAQHRTEAASRTLTESKALCTHVGEYDSRMMFEIRAAQVEAQSGDPSAARQRLQLLSRELARNGWGDLAREASSALKH